jgi:hypothetical protein
MMKTALDILRAISRGGKVDTIKNDSKPKLNLNSSTIRNKNEDVILRRKIGEERERRDEIIRACVQLLSHTLQSPSLCPAFLALDGLPVLLSFPYSVQGASLGLGGILQSLTDSPQLHSKNMLSFASSIVNQLLSQCYSGTRDISQKVQLLSPIFERSPLALYQALNSAVINPNLNPKDLDFSSLFVDIKQDKTEEKEGGKQEREGQKEEGEIEGKKERGSSTFLQTSDQKNNTPPTILSEANEREIRKGLIDSAINLIFARVVALCRDCTKDGDFVNDRDMNRGKNVPKSNSVEIDGDKKRSESPQSLLTDSLHLLAELLHCLPSRKDSLCLSRSLIKQAVCYIPDSNSATDHISGALKSASMIELLISTVLLPRPLLSPSPSYRSRPFPSSCMSAVVYLMSSLLSACSHFEEPIADMDESRNMAEREKRDREKKEGEEETMDIVTALFLALISGFETILKIGKSQSTILFKCLILSPYH